MKNAARLCLFMCLSFVVVHFGYGQVSENADFQLIKSILQRQNNDWNQGDLDGFMKGYWQSEKLMFIGQSGITYGWEQTLQRYKKNYPDQATMGKLTFTLLEMQAISKKAVLVVGKWELQRTKGNVDGHFSLLWKKIKGEWVIVADHSS